MSRWQLRLNPRSIPAYAGRYPDADDEVIAIGRRARRAGHYCLAGFLAVCKWKSPRSQPRCRRNSPDDVAEITRIALSTPAERLRVGALLCLAGIGWPTASVLLHLGHRDRYPILDFRALWSWGFDTPPAYSFTFWWEYVQRCRELASDRGVDMRTLDRALWQYSKEHQQ